MSYKDAEVVDNLIKIDGGVGDLVNVVNELPNQHVEVINRLDQITELLERIAVALEERN